MNDEHAIVFRLLKYVVPVFTFAVVFNVPKFLEARIIYANRTGDPNEPSLMVTDLRLNPDYAIYYNNWTRLAVLGIIPAVMLVFFNAKIYQDIRVSIYLTFLLHTNNFNANNGVELLELTLFFFLLIKARRARRRPQNPLPAASRTDVNGEHSQFVSKTNITRVNASSNTPTRDTIPHINIDAPTNTNEVSQPLLNTPGSNTERNSLAVPQVHEYWKNA